MSNNLSRSVCVSCESKYYRKNMYFVTYVALGRNVWLCKECYNSYVTLIKVIPPLSLDMDKISL